MTELTSLAWKGRFGGTGNFPTNGSYQLPSWRNKVRLRGSWRTFAPTLQARPPCPFCQPPVFFRLKAIRSDDWARPPRLHTSQPPFKEWLSTGKQSRCVQSYEIATK
jgi:hypothetical protein